jgi:hypothetical protein
MNNDLRQRFIAEMNIQLRIQAQKRLIRSMINAIDTRPSNIILSRTRWRLLTLDAQLSGDIRRYRTRSRIISLLSSVFRTNSNGDNNNNNNGDNANNNGNVNNNSGNASINSNINNRDIITLLLFGVLLTSIFVLLAFSIFNYIPGLLAYLSEVGYLFNLFNHIIS